MLIEVLLAAQLAMPQVVTTSFPDMSHNYHVTVVKPRLDAELAAAQLAQAQLEAATLALNTSKPAPKPVPISNYDAGSIQARLMALGGQPLVNLIAKESGFNPYAVNPSSGACGLFQRLPCSVPLGNADAQIADGMAYIQARYGTSANAWAFWLSHHWY